MFQVFKVTKRINCLTVKKKFVIMPFQSKNTIRVTLTLNFTWRAFLGRREVCLLLWWLGLCLHIVHIHLCFIFSYNGFQEIFIVICHFKEFFTNPKSALFLILSHRPQNKLFRHSIYMQFFRQNFLTWTKRNFLFLYHFPNS